MARKPTTVEEKIAELLVPVGEAELKLDDRVKKGKELLNSTITNRVEYEEVENKYYKWDNFNNELLKRLFTTDEYKREYSWWGVMSMSYGEPSLSEKVSKLIDKLKDKIQRLETIIEKLELIPTVGNIKLDDSVRSKILITNKKVFVVHGRDELAKTNLETLLHEMGLETIVLHRQADEGQTIIEKFEKHSDVGYAFILLTPDEIAYFTHEDSLPDADRKKEKRARANVIFEFGYFVGKLGRQKVCCVYTGDVSLPSDVSGMIYKKYISSVEEVAYSITKDLKAVGIIN